MDITTASSRGVGGKFFSIVVFFSIMLPHTRSVLHPLSSHPPGAAGRCSSNGQDITLSDMARLSAKVRPPEKLLLRWWELRTGAVSIRATGLAGRQPWCVRQ